MENIRPTKTISSIEFWRTRIENALFDIDFKRKSYLFSAVDAFLWIEAFLGPRESLYRDGAHRFITSDHQRIVLFPEALMEISDKIREGESEILAIDIKELRERYLKNTTVQEFMRAMRNDHNWGEVIPLVGRLFWEKETRTHTRRLFELIFASEYSEPLRDLDVRIRKGTIRDVSWVESEFGCNQQTPSDVYVELAYERLRAMRNRPRNDYVDARIYGRVKTLNQCSIEECRFISSRFVSHESMITYLEGSGRESDRGERVVRSYCDNSVVQALLSQGGRYRTRLSEWKVKADRISPVANTDWIDKTKEAEKLAAEIEALLEEGGVELPRVALQGSEAELYLDDILRERVVNFFDILQRIHSKGYNPTCVFEGVKDQVQKLWEVLRGLEEDTSGLEEYRKRIVTEEWKLSERVFGDAGADPEFAVEWVLAGAASGDPAALARELETTGWAVGPLLEALERTQQGHDGIDSASRSFVGAVAWHLRLEAEARDRAANEEVVRVVRQAIRLGKESPEDAVRELTRILRQTGDEAFRRWVILELNKQIKTCRTSGDTKAADCLELVLAEIEVGRRTALQ